MEAIKENAFPAKIIEIKDLFNEPAVAINIYLTLVSVLERFGISSRHSRETINRCFSLAKNYLSVPEYERDAHNLLKETGITKEIPLKLAGRSKLIHDQIKPYLIPGSILDLGCGDGKVSGLLKMDGFDVVLADIYRNGYINETQMEFRLIKNHDQIPAADDEFANSLLLTVLHHSDNPIKILQEIFRVTQNNGRVVVIESVYGVDGFQLSEGERHKLQSYLSLNSEQQRMVNIFFDHFYNRLINYTEDVTKKANVPYNFNTPEGWKEIFEENGFVQENVIHLGVDQPIVPEYHTLHVLKVIK